MAENTNFYHDIDIYGKEKREGIALEYNNQDAIKNALLFFLSARKGDYLRNPSAGSPIDFSTFKVMNEQSLERIGFMIKNAINNFFTPAIELQEINIIPEFENRFLQIDIVYLDAETLEINTVSIYTDTEYRYQKFDFVNVEYSGENLYKFVVLQKTSDPSKRLLYNSEEEFWHYGKFKLVNLTTSDPYFDDLLAVANT